MLNTFEFTLENKWISAISLILAVTSQLQYKELIIYMYLEILEILFIWRLN